jgi:hypothetical protein
MVAPILVALIAMPTAALLIPLVFVPLPAFLFALAFVICIVTLVFGFVFLRSHEVHGPIAGIVFTAMPAPISCVTRRNMEV